MIRVVLAAWALPLVAPNARAQARETDSVAVVGMRIEPDTVTVGERFRAAVFVRAPKGSRLSITLPPATDGAYQAIGEARVYPADSSGVLRAVATLVLWITDPAATARADATITLPGGPSRTIPVQLSLPAVRSVLPADSTRPRPPKDILPTPTRDGKWMWVAAGLLALLLLLGGWAWRRRRGSRHPASDPRVHALAALDRLRAGGVLEADVTAFAAETSVIFRAFAAAADPRLGADLTTAELLLRLLDTGARAEDVDALDRALSQADLAKFARQPPSRERALQDWQAARRWIHGFRHPTPPSASGSTEAGR
jgi:hypothetical protein